MMSEVKAVGFPKIVFFWTQKLVLFQQERDAPVRTEPNSRMDFLRTRTTCRRQVGGGIISVCNVGVRVNVSENVNE